MNSIPLQVVCQWHKDGRPIGPPRSFACGASATGQMAPPDGTAGPLVLNITLPITQVSGIWMPYGGRDTLQKVVWRGKLLVTPQFYPGLIGFVDQHLCNRLFLRTEPSDREAVISWALDQAAACYRIEVDFGVEKDERPVSVGYSTEAAFVHDIASRMLADAAPAVKTASPQEFFEPSFCTWYAYHGALEEKSVERCAQLARDLGCGTFILDDSWQYDADQRVGAVLGPWHRFTGDYEPSQRKFPDFGAHVDRVKAMGLRYLLWVAPMLIGVESKAYKRLGQGTLKSWLDEGAGVVDPRHAETTAYVAATMERLVRDYAIDGFKVDYDYALLGPGMVPYGVGAEYSAFVGNLVARVRRIRPSFEWNLMLNAFSPTVTRAFRCVDVPFDPDSNRMFMANLRPLAGRLALYSDPALWSAQDPISAVHRHVVPSLFCVPSIGAPLLDLPADHLLALRAWLGFYRRHQPVFNRGEFRAHWAAGDFQSFRAALGEQRIIAAFSDYPVLVSGSGEVLVINSSDEARLRLEMESPAQRTIENADGKPLSSRKQLTKGFQLIDCPPGGIVRLQM